MSIEHIVVDGSNIATEGRSLPSLKQLEEAVAELQAGPSRRRDHRHRRRHLRPPHRPVRARRASSRPCCAGEYVHPPAGAIGRGDAFLLRVAEKVDGTVLSNDSFQEFHGEHPWLFERGRLLGGTPVPGIGWIFSPRQPVRGPRSRQAVRETTQAKKRVTKAIAVATKEVVEPAGRASSDEVLAPALEEAHAGAAASSPDKAGDRARDAGKPHPAGRKRPIGRSSRSSPSIDSASELEGEVESYTSHGAVVRVGDMRCYVPLANLGDPPPRSAREVLKRNEQASFVLTALDPHRRGAELALPGIAHVSGHPREETVAAEVRLAAKSPRKRAGAQGTRRAELGEPPVPTAATPPPGRRRPGQRRYCCRGAGERPVRGCGGAAGEAGVGEEGADEEGDGEEDAGEEPAGEEVGGEEGRVAATGRAPREAGVCGTRRGAELRRSRQPSEPAPESRSIEAGARGPCRQRRSRRPHRCRQRRRSRLPPPSSRRQRAAAAHRRRRRLQPGWRKSRPPDRPRLRPIRPPRRASHRGRSRAPPPVGQRRR